MEKAQHYLSVGCDLGEGPIWCWKEKKLYWVDINANGFYRLDPGSGNYEHVPIDPALSSIAVREEGGFIAAAWDRLILIDTKSDTYTTIKDSSVDTEIVRYNDGAAGPGGAYWIGTMEWQKGEYRGVLYRYSADYGMVIAESEIGTSNGIGWSLDNKTMYYTDSSRKTIYQYDFDAASGEIENRRVFLAAEEGDGSPDGLCVDSEGCIWSAFFRGSAVIRFDPAGKEMERITVDAPHVTSCCFGGSDLMTLYITTARTGMNNKELEQFPSAGDLFVYHSDVAGRREFQFKG